MKIITAIGNQELNESLREIPNIEVIGKDIQYQEGILDVLETKEDIDIVALSNLLPEEMNFLYLIDRIKKIKENVEIVVFLEKEDIKIENFLNSKKIYKIYHLDENGIEVFINSLRNTNDVSLGISKEIEELKNIIISPGIEIVDEEYIQKDCKIISISGNSGSGKTIIACVLAKQLEKKKKKVALIDLNKENDISIILGIDAKSTKKEIKTSRYLTIYTYNNGFDCLQTELHQVNAMIEKMRKEYDYIIFDTSLNYKYINLILNESNKIIFLLEPNLLEISKAMQNLEIITNSLNIDKSKIKIVFNKTNKFQITESILEEVFSDFEKIGSISYDEKYNLFINQHLSLLDNINLYEIIYEN